MNAAAKQVVELLNVSKTFNDKRVLKAFDLSVAAGEFVAIVGDSGSGKSTLLNIIGLLDKADEGSVVRLFGKPAPKISSSQARKLLRSKLAYVFQNAALIEQDSVDDNLKLAQRFSGTPRKKRSEQRKSVLQSVGLGHVGKKKVYQLSGGEQQRLAIASMQLHPSELILADEPTGSLDPANRGIVMQLLVDLNRQGKTVIVVTHDPVVAKGADRMVRLEY